MDAPALRSLLRRYKNGPSLSDTALQDALDDPDHGTGLKEWLQIHTEHENLLTEDELSLYLSLDKSGQVDKLIESRDLSSVQGASEVDVRVAIEELGRSTAEINKQTDLLKQHQAALAKLVQGHGKTGQARSKLEEKRTTRLDADQKALSTQVEDLSQTLALRTTELEQNASAADEILHHTVDGLFQHDDKLLLSLQKLSRELDPEDPEEKQNVEKLRETCMRLIKFTVETARTKLDRQYLEALASAQRDGVAERPSAQDINELQDEVESLYAEILPVAQMSVEQQYLEPALKSLSDKNGQSLSRSTAAVVYINACLDFLVDRIARLSSHIETLRSHQSATSSLVESTRAELAVTIPSAKKHDPPALPASPVRPRSNTASLNTPGHRRNLSSYETPSPNESPVEALMRLLAISLPSDTASRSPDPIATLARTQADREVKASEVSSGAQESAEKAAASHLLDARVAVQLLRDSMLAESPFGGEVRLMDPGIEESIVVLGQEVGKIGERVQVLEGVTARARKGGSERQREMVERWGR